ncbi:ferritin-like domain-containing protein [Pedobacter antarcticus]|uniref:ferritin-like domain-containing protein n=1 Tax=Pedobacter antarcticus TaxID=34086 RepID=UPI00088C6C72|nr:ferritin-like domain-containing protein [Pedobacter antarcticus]SDL73422.1 Ferritin-like domain-containing protein [Pedobacter antarcticus]
MKNSLIEPQENPSQGSDILNASFKRRSFLQYAGAGLAGVALIAAGCKKEQVSHDMGEGVDLGSGDIGILNYAYALEQLEAAFYAAVIQNPYANMPANELALLTDIRDHELAHREFFKAALSTKAIPALEVNFSSINFSSRDSVLGTAKVFEDLGVSAYNGAGKLIQSKEYLLLAGKIVSVEARHAALIRDLLENGSFANSEVIDMNGLDKARTPKEVLTMAQSFIKTTINASSLPS